MIKIPRLTLFVDFFMTTNRHSIFNAYMIKEFTFEKFFQTHFHHSTCESTINIQCIYDQGFRSYDTRVFF